MNYAELKTAIADYMHRTDLTTKVDTFIDMFEAHANRTIRTAQMEVDATGTTTSSALTLPADFLELRQVKNGTTTLQYVTPDRMQDYQNGTLRVYTLIGGQIRTNANGSLSYTYYQKIPALTDANTSNWLLASHQDAYLWGSIAEGMIYSMDEGAAKFIQLRDTAIDAIRKADRRARWGNSPLRVSPSNTQII